MGDNKTLQSAPCPLLDLMPGPLGGLVLFGESADFQLPSVSDLELRGSPSLQGSVGARFISLGSSHSVSLCGVDSDGILIFVIGYSSEHK